MLFKLLILSLQIYLSFGLSTSRMLNECQYVSATLPTQYKIKNQNQNTKYVMDDLYKRFAKKYHMSSSQIKNCLDNKYKTKK